MKSLAKICLAFASLYSWGALAGAANATLECKGDAAKYGTIALSGEIPGDFSEFNLELKTKAGSITFSDANHSISVIAAFEHGVFTLTVMHELEASLLLYALPKTVKASGGGAREVEASFDAVLLQAPKPGYSGPQNYDSKLREIALKCSFKHST